MQLTLVVSFYVLVGIAVAVAEFLSDTEQAAGERWFRVASAVFFWPMHLPFLLKPRESESAAFHVQSSSLTPAIPGDSMSQAIAQVEVELDRAFKSLDGWAETILSDERERLAELRSAWKLQAARVRELDRLLREPSFADVADGEKPSFDNERIRHSQQARQKNIERLAQLRRQLYDDLMGTLAWVRELVTMIHLAKYTGAPASRAEELITQIAAAVEGLSEVTDWQEEPLVANC